MKRFFSCFLFQARPEESLSPRCKAAFWGWNALLAIGSAVGLGLVSLLLATGSVSVRVMYMDYLRHPVLLILNLLPPVLLLALLYALTGRTWLAYLITALPVIGLSLGNYYKLTFRDDPVLASDLLILGEAGKMAGQYRLFVDFKIALVLLCTIAGGVVLLLAARGRPRAPVRIGTAAAALAAALALFPTYASDEVYSKNANTEHINQWSATQQYTSRGLVYPFLHSIKSALPNPPEGYSEKEAAALLAQYENAEIPEDKKVNIVGIMLEAFADFSVYDQIEFQQDAYALYHALEEESYSGTLLTNIFAGGTVDTERAFLTGMAPNDINYRSNTSSYVWYLKSQGYRASGDHPCNNWFYNRLNINSYLGFDQYRFTEDFYGPVFGANPTLNDDGFIPELTRSILEQLEDDAPLFSFSVTYQGHGPYSDSICWWGEVDDFIGNHDLPQDQRTILANYLGSVISTQRYLAEMVDVFRESSEPIVLVLFGDHKPWLGNGSSVYSSLGIDLSQGTADSFYNYWSTRYLIWANDAAEAVIGHGLAGEGPDISPCFLMNELFGQLGWEGDAYMQAVEACRQELPMIHNGGMYLTADGQLTQDLNEEQQALSRKFRCLEYYRAHHFAYG